jgi:hypothetical protein
VGTRSWRPAGRCNLIATDIVGYGRYDRSREVQTYMRDSLYGILACAFRASGAKAKDVYFEDRGDGTVAAVSPEVPTSNLVHPFVDHVRAGLRRHNLVSAGIAQIRLRMALHTADAWTDSHGLVGAGPTEIFRLLEAPAFKEIIEHTNAYLGFIASAAIYKEAIKHAPGLVDPDDYEGVHVVTKEFSTNAWVRLLGNHTRLQVENTA